VLEEISTVSKPLFFDSIIDERNEDSAFASEAKKTKFI
jgi:hypothetical protein